LIVASNLRRHPNATDAAVTQAIVPSFKFRRQLQQKLTQQQRRC